METGKSVTKTVKKYGNSGGVYLPSSWVGGRVEVKLLNGPPRPGIDLPMALGESMRHVISILVYGSHARGEQEDGSDVDVLVVTDGHLKGLEMPPGLESMNYDITTMSADKFRAALEKDALFRKSLEDARAVFNGSFLEELKTWNRKQKTEHRTQKTENRKQNTAITVPAARIALARSSMGLVKSTLDAGGDIASLVYPLVMRLKEMLLVKCAQEGRKYSLELLEETVLKGGISKREYKEFMDCYRAARAGRPLPAHRFTERAFRQLLELLEGLIKDAEKNEKGAKGN